VQTDKGPSKREEKLKEELKKERERTKTLQERVKKEASLFKKEFADRTLKLITSGLGLVSALAWNELIKEVVSEYIKPLFGESSGLISLIIYAIFITALAVFVTYQLSKLTEKEID